MKKKTETVVKQIENDLVTVEILASSIVAISEGIKKLRAGKLTDDALILLIQHAAPAKRVGGYAKSPISAAEVRRVLAGLEDLSKTYVKGNRDGKA